MVARGWGGDRELDPQGGGGPGRPRAVPFTLHTARQVALSHDPRED